MSSFGAVHDVVTRALLKHVNAPGAKAGNRHSPDWALRKVK